MTGSSMPAVMIVAVRDAARLRGEINGSCQLNGRRAVSGNTVPVEMVEIRRLVMTTVMTTVVTHVEKKSQIVVVMTAVAMVNHR